MKNLVVLLVFAFLSLAVSAQYVDMREKVMSSGVFTSYSVDIDGVDLKVVEKEWQRFMKDHSGKTKKDRKSGESRTTGAAIGGVGGNVNVFASGSSIGSSVKYSAWIENNSIFLSETDETESHAVVTMLEQFILHMKGVRINMELDAEVKTLKVMQRDLNKEEKGEQRHHADIEKFKEKIKEAESGIQESLSLQEQHKQSIEGQFGIIESVKVKLVNVGLEDYVPPAAEKKDKKDEKKKEDKDSKANDKEVKSDDNN